ncbi:hypothetical protein MLD38_011356 [Melastoma candidum]|uniref:Uncharacterized protein n=1 Tax=Melastoma candidum TaxID=119954 RepID=A0ACB9R6X0_9MYRT|nr:hypothetical protein MLD38_011356 [Melastoma candidum]
MEVIDHFSHEHPLKLRELFVANSPPDLIRCGGCEFPIYGPVYCCERCKFVLHKSCAMFPVDIEHPFHPQHQLAIFRKGHWPLRSKGREVQRETHVYRCLQRDCSFELEGVDAIATLPDEDGPGEDNSRETILHFSHEHPLTSCRVKGECKLECMGCRRMVSGEAYICYGCAYLLHKECTELPKRVQHPFHIVHPLELIVHPTGISKCVVCEDPCVFSYGCRECQYILDVPCALSAVTPRNQGDKEGPVIKHSAHDHELARFHLKSEIRVRCAFCSKFLSGGEAYGCPQCSFFLHELCADEPAEVAHPFHPEHHLTLVNSAGCSMAFCACCFRGTRECQNYYFICKLCNYSLDTVCCLESLACFKGAGSLEITHSLHEHQLRFGRNPYEHCVFCGDTTDRPSYFCYTKNCKFWIHKSCSELPNVMEHPFHPQHQLKVNPSEAREFTCSACNIKSTNLAFSCIGCGFHLDSSCAVQIPDLKHPLHEHELAYYKEAEQLKCYACGDHCSLDLYRCVPCNFNLHRSCLPLPQLVDHKRHWHPLTLHNKYLEDDTGEYYCEICTERRHPDRGVYCCIGCEFFAHIECTLDERKWVMNDDLVLKEMQAEIMSLQATRETKKEELTGIMRELEELLKTREAICSRTHRNEIN